jgi:hypothetical protein
MSKTDWKAMPHEIPDGWEKYVVLLCAAVSAESELKILTRFQKVVRMIHDENVKQTASQDKGGRG